MRCIGGTLTAMTIAIVLQGEAGAIAKHLGDKDIERALELARAPEPKRAAFHAPYIMDVNDAVVAQIEVLSEFRRYVLTAEEQLRMGNWLFARSVQDAREKLRPWRERVSLLARLRFHPQNALITVPSYDVTLAGPDLVPVDVVRTPIMARLSGRRGDVSAPLVGATIEAVFDAASIGQTTRPVSVTLAARPIASVTIDFGRLE
jgi:hypothetical protein